MDQRHSLWAIEFQRLTHWRATRRAVPRIPYVVQPRTTRDLPNPLEMRKYAWLRARRKWRMQECQGRAVSSVERCPCHRRRRTVQRSSVAWSGRWTGMRKHCPAGPALRFSARIFKTLFAWMLRSILRCSGVVLGQDAAVWWTACPSAPEGVAGSSLAAGVVGGYRNASVLRAHQWANVSGLRLSNCSTVSVRRPTVSARACVKASTMASASAGGAPLG